MIPDLVVIPGAPHAVLPPGEHAASLTEIEEHFANNDQRQWLFEGITEVARALRTAGCGVMYIGGSFTSDKVIPGDFDGYWEPHGVIASLLDPILREFANECAAQKWKYRGEMYIAAKDLPHSRSIISSLTTEKYTGEERGLLRIALRGSRL